MSNKLPIQLLPDITSNTYTAIPSTLQWVGMEKVCVPITLSQSDGSHCHIIAKANVFVSLNSEESKGIHMSRMHLAINQLANQNFDQQSINALLDNLIASQNGISHQAKLEFEFDLMLKKPALLSDEFGYQSYPVVVRAEKSSQGYDYQFELTIPYSSTCPCSASLSRQLYADAINQSFTGSTIDKEQLLNWIQSPTGSIATPHSQRSYAYIHLSLGNKSWPVLSSLIFELESVIKTPVQTAVKRIDEQEFAKLNAQNLMFCEDAARHLKKSLEKMAYVKDYWFKVEHQESLHAHNAVVIDQKYINGK